MTLECDGQNSQIFEDAWLALSRSERALLIRNWKQNEGLHGPIRIVRDRDATQNKTTIDTAKGCDP